MSKLNSAPKESPTNLIASFKMSTGDEGTGDDILDDDELDDNGLDDGELKDEDDSQNSGVLYFFHLFCSVAFLFLLMFPGCFDNVLSTSFTSFILILSEMISV